MAERLEDIDKYRYSDVDPFRLFANGDSTENGQVLDSIGLDYAAKRE